MQARIAARHAASLATNISPGRTALLGRISPTTLIGTESPAPAPPTRPTDIGVRLVVIAVSAYGGLWPEGAPGPSTVLFNTIPAAGGLAAAVVELAKTKIGSRYVAGVRGPNAFDCSTFTYWLYKTAGLDWSMMLSYQQFWPERHLPNQKKRWTVEIPKDQVQPGDLVFFDNVQSSDTSNPRMLSGRAGVDHVGLMIDPAKGRMIHAANPDTGVVESSIHGQYSEPIGYARVIDPDAPAAWTPGDYGSPDPMSPVYDGKIVNVNVCKNSLVAFLYGIGWRGENLREAYAVAMRESGGRFKERFPPSDSNDWGLFQFNYDTYGGGKTDWWDDSRMQDGTYNAQQAFIYSQGGKTWYPWGLDGRGRENADDYRDVGWSEKRIITDIMEPYWKFYSQFPCLEN